MMTTNQLRAAIASLRLARGRHTGMVSLYVPARARCSDVRGYVKNELIESENIKDKTNRKNVISSLTSIFS